MLSALLSAALSRAPWVVEALWASWLGPALARSLSLLTGWVPFSVAGLLVACLLLATARGVARGLARVRSGARRSEVLVDGATSLAGVTGGLLIAFYLLWGLNYARAPLDQRLGIATDAAMDASALRALTAHAVERTNAAYRAVHGTDDLGSPTDDLVLPRPISRALETGWARVADPLGMGPTAGKAHGPVKTRGTTWLLESLDIAGIYVPFTGEAHTSGNQPDLSMPAVVAHEQAHQRGVARENEATFAGVLAAIHADDPLARYSGWARALRALQADLSAVDPSAWRELRTSLSPGVVRDWLDYYEWLRESRSAAAPVVDAANDVYLRAHGVPGGIESYGRVTTLLLEWARLNRGRLTLDPAR